MSQRLFIGLDLDATTRAAVVQLLSGLRERAPEGLRLVDPATLHLTLRFLGEVEDARVPDVEAAVARVAAAAAPFTLALHGLGCFGRARKARVLWMGVPVGGAGLAGLAAALDDALAPLGFPPEEREYTPHLTLGRARRRPADLRALLELGTPEPSMTATELVLFRSHLSSAGPRYEALLRAPLGGA